MRHVNLTYASYQVPPFSKPTMSIQKTDSRINDFFQNKKVRSRSLYPQQTIHGGLTSNTEWVD